MVSLVSYHFQPQLMFFLQWNKTNGLYQVIYCSSPRANKKKKVKVKQLNARNFNGKPSYIDQPTNQPTQPPIIRLRQFLPTQSIKTPCSSTADAFASLVKELRAHNISCDFLTHRPTFFLKSSLLSLHSFCKIKCQKRISYATPCLGECGINRIKYIR